MYCAKRLALNDWLLLIDCGVLHVKPSRPLSEHNILNGRKSK